MVGSHQSEITTMENELNLRFVPQHSLTKEQMASLSNESRAFYRKSPQYFMAAWNEDVLKERTRAVSILRLQESLGPEFRPLANAMLTDGRYTAEDLAKIAGTQISARMGNWHAKEKLSAVESDATAEWDKSPLVRATFQNKKADYIAFRAYAAASNGGAR
jgi:hypothetical protein